MIPFLQDALWAVPGEKAGLQQPPAAPSSLWPPLAESIEVRSTGEPTEDVLVVSAKKAKTKTKTLAVPTCPSFQKKSWPPLASGSLWQPPAAPSRELAEKCNYPVYVGTPQNQTGALC